MPKKFYRAKRTIGMIGMFAAAVIACMCGLIRPLWNCQTDQMVGSVSYSMGNWPRCIRAAARKMETIIQVHNDITEVLGLIGNWSRKLLPLHRGADLVRQTRFG